MTRSTLNLKLDKLEGTPLKAMLWHLNEAVKGPYVTEQNMRGCTDLAIYEALCLLKKESESVFAQTVNMMGGIA